MKKLKKWVSTYLLRPDHDQRKQIASSCNTGAALVVVQYFINKEGIAAILMLFIAFAMWVFGVVIVRKDIDDKEE
ncbi:hypothetical protein [Cardiobacterium hominis]|jgi:hypothetical protein|uniref:hypothetical protein n=1 Tax=Cardiobacterium hominis TaxID=2718 RepID=UPI0028E4EF14|nr:hypothetical protein [Cardiobacterium hominis]